MTRIYTLKNQFFSGFILMSLGIFFAGCSDQESGTSFLSRQNVDTIPPIIHIAGKEIDTAYLQITYLDPIIVSAVKAPQWQPFIQHNYFDNGVNGQDEDGISIHCLDPGLVHVSGSVNLQRTGTYYLTYTAEDEAGNQSASLTRTVHVIENSAGYLGGIYDAACTCTASGDGITKTSSITYTAQAAASASLNNSIDMSALQVGENFVTPTLFFSGNKISINFLNLSPADAVSSGTLSPSKTSFTIETADRDFHSPRLYSCKTVFRKKLWKSSAKSKN